MKKVAIKVAINTLIFLTINTTINIIGSLDEKIEKNAEMNNNLLDLASLLVEENYSNSNDFNTLFNIINFVKGKKPKAIDNVKQDKYEKYLTIACLNNLEINYADPEKMILSDNSILMVMDGASSGDIYFNDYGIIGSTLARIDITDKNYLTSYIYFVLRKYNNLIKSKNTGSAIPHTDKVFVGTLEVPIIKKAKQMRYERILNRTLKIQQENLKLQELKQLYLQKFFG